MCTFVTSGQVASIVRSRTPRRLLVDDRRDAVGREHDDGTLGHLVRLVDEHRPAALERGHHVLVVDDLFAHEDRRAVQLQRLLDRDHGAVHARAVPARSGQQDTTAGSGQWGGAVAGSVGTYRRGGLGHASMVGGAPAGRPALHRVTTVTAPQVVIPATAGATTPEHPWPVRLLTAKMTEYIAKAPAVWLEGQVVQLTRRPGQGTVYLTLRDTDVDLSFSVTVAARVLDGLAAPLADGAHVVVHARPQLFPRRGSLSLAADDLRPVGVGELLARLEHLRRVLAAEGVFAADRKKPLPFLPRRRRARLRPRASAAERDVVENARRRWPASRFDIRAVAVQGPNCVPEVIDAIESLDARARGRRDRPGPRRRLAGGPAAVQQRGAWSGPWPPAALPWSARSATRSTPRCWTSSPTSAPPRPRTPPSGSCPTSPRSSPRVAQARALGRRALQARLEREERLLADLRSRPALADPARVLAGHAEQLQGLRARARSCVLARLHRADDDLVHLRERVAALSPAATLARGYAVVQDRAGAVVRSPDGVEPGDRLRIRRARRRARRRDGVRE